MSMLLELRDISVAYDGASQVRPFLLEHLDLGVQKGDFTIIRGASGFGKSTILRLICSIQPIHSGQILLRGEPLGSLRPSALKT
ncbi:MAG: ATP-binding cassette domain-containing protein [Chlorobiaceae bacterium]|nr:ATP-binding cassette domain-containing protein [Chlorobiaceae bacterium]